MHVDLLRGERPDRRPSAAPRERIGQAVQLARGERAGDGPALRLHGEHHARAVGRATQDQEREPPDRSIGVARSVGVAEGHADLGGEREYGGIGCHLGHEGGEVERLGDGVNCKRGRPAGACRPSRRALDHRKALPP